jgi:GGDEF domain-containing protein
MTAEQTLYPVDIENSADAFAHLELFRDIDLSRLHRLLEQCREVEVAPGDIVLEAGTENRAAYLVIDGELEVRLLDPNAAPIVTVCRGASVGELSVLSRLKVTAFAVATKPSRLLMISDELMWKFVATSHEFSRNMLAMLCGRVHDDNLRLLDSMDAQHRYQKAAKVDALTGLFNRRAFDEILDRQWQRARVESAPLTVLFVDIDHFKSINDQF